MTDLPEDLERHLDALYPIMRAALREVVVQTYAAGRRDQAEETIEIVREARPVAPPPMPPQMEVDEALPELVDAATLAPLTPLQFKVFSVFVAAKGEYLSASQIDDRCAKTGAFGSLSAVRDKGYLIGRPTPGKSKNQLTYHVACYGAPRLVEENHRGPLKAAPVVHQQPQPIQAVAPRVDEPRPSPQKTSPPPPPRPAPEPVQPRSAPPPPAPVRAAAPPLAPAPAPEPKKYYPPVAAVRKVTAPPPRAPLRVGSNSATQAAFGADGNGGHRMVDESRIKVSTYLIRKGHMVSPAAGGAWRIDGRVLDRTEVLDLINEHRAKADLPPANLADLE